MHTHVILGAGGAISKSLIRSLANKNQNFLLLSRKKKSVEGYETQAVDVLDVQSLIREIPKNSIVHMLVGFEYHVKIWEKSWVPAIKNVIDVCVMKNSKLVFFDNVYSLGHVQGAMTEMSPLKPSSKKGEIRKKVIEHIQQAIEQKGLKALIARAADFYGPDAEQVSFLNIVLLQRVLQNKAPQWIGDITARHSYTFTDDCGKALHILSQDDSAYGQVWNMPTASPAMNGIGYVDLAYKTLSTEKKKPQIMNYLLLSILGLFIRPLKETKELYYQNKFDYVFDSSKFEKVYGFKPTSYEKGFEITFRKMQEAAKTES